MNEKVIWKYSITATDSQELTMPKDATILALQIQNDTPCVWALVDPTAEKESRTFKTFGTGHPISSNRGNQLCYIGSYQKLGGALVFHVFESKRNMEKNI